MPLADDISALKERVLDDLILAHNYYLDTKVAWKIVHKVIASGNSFTIRNAATGSVTPQSEFGAKAYGYVAEQLTEATFQQFLSLFEGFYFDLLRLWLTAYPQSLGKKTVDFKWV